MMMGKKLIGTCMLTLLMTTISLTGCDFSKYRKEETVRVTVENTTKAVETTTKVPETTEQITTQRETPVKNTATTTERQTYETYETKGPLETIWPIEPHQQVSEYMIPDSASTYLTKERLQGMTADQAEIARNEIFARHGRLFNDEMLQSYFNACSWYEGTIAPEDFDSSVFNDYELANIKLLSDYEESFAN